MKSYNFAIIAGVLVILLFFYSCGSGGYEVEELTDYKDTLSSVYNTEIKQEIEKPNLEIKEVTQSPKNISYNYTVQIGAFLDEKNALEFVARSKKILSLDVRYELIDDYYKVREGNFQIKEDASSELNRIKNLGYPDAFIIEFKK